MQANIFQATCVVIATLVICLILRYVLRKFVTGQFATILSPVPVTAYGKDMLKNRGFTECTLVHTRAGRSNVFFDADQWLSDSNNVQQVTAWIVKRILDAQTDLNNQGQEIAGLAFIEKDSGPTGLISLQHLISTQTDMKTCVVRLRRWPFLPQAAVKGEPPSQGSKWIIISDVATTAGHIQKAAKILNSSCWEANVPFAIVLLNRGGKNVFESLSANGIKLISNEEIEALFDKRKKIFDQQTIDKAA